MNKKFPKQIPVFPLSGVIYFPKTNLPLNIFEERYLDLVNDSFRNDKLMGMVQSKKENSLVYKVGCLGKISDFQETSDGRVLINLTGITRFEIMKEVTNQKKYREFEVDYKKFSKDILDSEKITLVSDNLNFTEKVKKFFERNGLMINWKEFEKQEISIRQRFRGNIGEMKLDSLLSKLLDEVNNKRRIEKSQR